VGAGHFSTAPGVHPDSYPIDTGGSFPGVKRPEREADHSPPNAEVMNVWCYTSTPIRLHGELLSYAKGQLYLYVGNVTSPMYVLFVYAT
jgi:hypothetical protein